MFTTLFATEFLGFFIFVDSPPLINNYHHSTEWVFAENTLGDAGLTYGITEVNWLFLIAN